MTTPTDDETPGAEKPRLVMRDMLSSGREPAPPVTPAELRRRAEDTRHRHIDSKVLVALVAVAAVIAALIVIGPLRSGNTPTHQPTPANQGSTTTTNTTSTTTTTTIPAAAASELASYVADEEHTDAAAAATSGATARYGLSPFVADQSAPVEDDGHTVAVVAFSYDSGGHPVQVLQYSGGQWAPVAELAGPTGQGNEPGTVVFLTQGPIAVADVTDDGRPDFLVLASAADNVPGFVISQVGGTWHYVSFSGPYASPGTEVISRGPQFQGNTLVSDYNNCVPDCAGGQNSTIVWTYQPSTGEFTAPDPPGYPDGQTAGACVASALSASATEGSGAGGHEAVVVVFTNISSQTCSLNGYPTTAWFEGPGGVHLPATVTQEVASGSPATVTLAPGQKAATTVWTNNPAGPSASSCNPVAASAVTVGTSTNTSALTTPIGITVCSTNNSIGTTMFTAGTAQSAM